MILISNSNLPLVVCAIVAFLGPETCFGQSRENIHQYNANELWRSVFQEPSNYCVAFPEDRNAADGMFVFSAAEKKLIAGVPNPGHLLGDLSPVTSRNQRFLVTSSDETHRNSWRAGGMLKIGSNVLNLTIGESLHLARSHQMVMNQDLFRVVSIKDGKLWRATYDWATGKLDDESQVAHTGKFSDASIFAWVGNDLYLSRKGRFTSQIIRVDLMSGESESLDPFFELSNSYVSPDGRFAIHVGSDLVTIYDLASDRSTSVSNRPSIKHPLNFDGGRYTQTSTVSTSPLKEGSGGAGSEKSYIWFGEDRLLVSAQTGGMAEINCSSGTMTIHDFGMGPMTYAQYLYASDVRSGRHMAAPSCCVGNWVVIDALPQATLISSHTDQKFVRTGPFLYDLKSKNTRPLTEIERGVAWKHVLISEDLQLCEVCQGSVDQLGTWVLDNNTGQKRQLLPTGFTTIVGRTDKACVFAKGEDKSIFQIDGISFERSDCKDLNGISKIGSFSKPFDLPGNGNPWELQTFENPNWNGQVDLSDPVLAEALQFRKLITELGNSSPNAIEAFNNEFGFSKLAYHSRCKLVSEALRAWPKFDPKVHRNGIKEIVDFRVAFDESMARQYVFDRSMLGLFSIMDGYEKMMSIDNEQLSRAYKVAERAADLTIQELEMNGLSASDITATSQIKDSTIAENYRRAKRELNFRLE